MGENVQELVFAALLLFVASGRLQVRENGIWEYDSLLRWNKITSHRWTDDGTLILDTQGWLMTLRGDLPVSPEHKEAVNAYLLERVPQTREF